MVTYVYRTVDLRSNIVLEDIDLRGVQFSTVLNAVGDLNATLYVPDTIKGHLLENATIPGRTGVYVLRNGVPVWGGIIWKRDWDESSFTYRLTCESWESYAYHYVQRLDKVYTSTDQMQIARELITQTTPSIQSQTGIEPPVASTSGILRQRYMYGYEFKTVGLELEKLSALIGSFDYRVENYIKSDGSFGRRYILGYPRLGNTADITDPSSLTFDYPGNLLPFSLHEDAGSGAWNVYSVGSGEGSAMLWSQFKNLRYDDAGWPQLDEVTQYKSVAIQATLDQHAGSDLGASLPPIAVWDFSLAPDSDVTIQDFSVGDSAVFRIQSRRWNGPVVFVARIARIEVTPPAPGGLEQVKLTLTAPVIGQDVTDDEAEPATNSGTTATVTTASASAALPVVAVPTSAKPPAPAPAPHVVPQETQAAKEILNRMQTSGASVFEDFTFYGCSPLVGKYNDDLSGQFWAAHLGAAWDNTTRSLAITFLQSYIAAHP